MSRSTSSETSSTLNSQIQNHLKEIFSDQRASDRDWVRFAESKLKLNHKTCGALNKIIDPPRPSGKSAILVKGQSFNQRLDSNEYKWYSKHSSIPDYGSSMSHRNEHSSSLFKNYFLGHINSVSDTENREFARVKDRRGKKTNLIYLFP